MTPLHTLRRLKVLVLFQKPLLLKHQSLLFVAQLLRVHEDPALSGIDHEGA